MNSLSLCVSSMTAAARAKRMLSEYGISSTIKKSDCSMANVGCSFEISLPSEKLNLAAEILRKNGIKLLK